LARTVREFRQHYPIEAASPQNVESVNIHQQDLSRGIPPWLDMMVNITILRLTWTNLAVLPSFIAELRNLVLLDITGNNLTELPAFISKLPKLRALYVSDNLLTALPDELQLLSKQLTALDVSRNNMSRFPYIIGSFHQHFFVGNNRNFTFRNMSFTFTDQDPVSREAWVNAKDHPDVGENYRARLRLAHLGWRWLQTQRPLRALLMVRLQLMLRDPKQPRRAAQMHTLAAARLPPHLAQEAITLLA
jgi:hypothetical protein